MTYNSIQPLMRIWLILLSYWPEFHTYFSKSGFATLRHIPTDATRKIFFLENYMICCFLSFFDSPGLAQPLVGIHTRLIRNSFAKTYRIFYISLESSVYKISKIDDNCLKLKFNFLALGLAFCRESRRTFKATRPWTMKVSKMDENCFKLTQLSCSWSSYLSGIQTCFRSN